MKYQDSYRDGSKDGSQNMFFIEEYECLSLNYPICHSYLEHWNHKFDNCLKDRLGTGRIGRSGLAGHKCIS